MKRLISALVATLVVASGAAVYVTARPQPKTYTLTADIQQAPNLFAGGRVMVRGVEVGTITEVTPLRDAVRVTMEIDEGVEVPDDVRASIIPITLIADRYVQLHPQYIAGPSLADGAHIPLERTSIPAELDDVLTQVRGLLRALQPERGEDRGPLTQVVTSLDAALKSRGDDLGKTLDDSAAVLANLAGSNRDITKLIQNLDRLFITLAGRSSEIGLINERFELVAEALEADRADLEGTIENLAFFSGEAARLVDESGGELATSFVRLRRVLRTVLKHQGSLSEGIAWSNVIAQGLGATDGGGRGLNAYSGLQAAPGTPGAKYNYRLDARDTITCERTALVVGQLLQINPGAPLRDLVDTFMAFIPDFYDEDIRFLVRKLVILCSDYNKDPAARAAKVVRRLARDIGEKRLQRLLVRWALMGDVNGGSKR